jgi:hypothetical protein
MAQDDGGGYGRWRRHKAVVAMDSVVAAAQQWCKTARQQRRMARQRQGSEVAAVWHGGAGGHGMVVDGGGAMRTVRWRKVGEDGAARKVEDELERKKFEPSRLYKD